VHVDLGIDFDPDRPVGATGQVDLSASRTFKERLYAAGTTNVVDLQVGTTYFARFVAVDRNGNASPPSETSDGVLPKQLVNIDIGPDAISRLQIIDGEIVRAKIADLAVNSAKIEEIEVGKLRAGTMTANVVVGGRFSTPVVNGNQVQFDNAGIRLYQGNTVVGRWQVSDASMLVTGTYLSALSGRRINILPSGTMLFYPSAGTNFGFIENLDGDLRMSGQFNQDQRAGYLLIDETRAALTYSQIATYNKPRTRFQVDPIAAASWAPIISARIDRSWGSPDSLGPRWLYTNFSTSGDIGTSIVHLQQLSAASNHAVMYGANSDAGIVFDAGIHRRGAQQHQSGRRARLGLHPGLGAGGQARRRPGALRRRFGGADHAARAGPLVLLPPRVRGSPRVARHDAAPVRRGRPRPRPGARRVDPPAAASGDARGAHGRRPARRRPADRAHRPAAARDGRQRRARAIRRHCRRAGLRRGW
jgi:hypothetical protein